MKNKIYKLRCRNKGIVVTKRNLKNYDIVWIREFNTEIYSFDTLNFNVGEIVFDNYRRKLEIIEILKHPFFEFTLKDDYGFTITNNIIKIKK
ncbi:hypothetical protein Freya10_2 [Polaribacter phage Freya_10]|nr:hypothetical protein Freya9_2 [Polaribacter phage Freya_9]QQV91295.1 hypothetical protein Freya10_2 [Polaribacter phage Freya_10]